MTYKRYDIRSLNNLLDSKKNLITKKEICGKIGMTENGLKKAIDKGTLRFETFMDICDILKVDPCELFKYGNNVEIGYENSPRDDNEIKKMKREIDMLKDLIVIALKDRTKE